MAGTDIKPGDTVVLTKGAKRAAKKLLPFLNLKATVLECPRRGVWIKVQPQLEGASPMSWRRAHVFTLKGRLDPSKVLDVRAMGHIFSFIAPSNSVIVRRKQKKTLKNLSVLIKVSPRWTRIVMNARVDPAQVLDHNVLAHIFSFLGNGDDEARIKEELKVDFDEQFYRACGLHTLLCRVSRIWRQVYLDHAAYIVGWLFVDLTEHFLNRPGLHDAVIDWICKNKLRLIMFRYHPQQENVPLFRKVLEECDTTQLKCASVGVFPPVNYNKASQSILDDQKEVLAVLSRECPQLESLALAPYLTSDPEALSGLTNSPLFSMSSSVIKLTLLFGLTGPLTGPSTGPNQEFVRSLASSNCVNLKKSASLRLELPHQDFRFALRHNNDLRCLAPLNGWKHTERIDWDSDVHYYCPASLCYPRL